MLTRMLDTYKLFRPDVWYYNGGQKPVIEVRQVVGRNLKLKIIY